MGCSAFSSFFKCLSWKSPIIAIIPTPDPEDSVQLLRQPLLVVEKQPEATSGSAEVTSAPDDVTGRVGDGIGRRRVYAEVRDGKVSRMTGTGRRRGAQRYRRRVKLKLNIFEEEKSVRRHSLASNCYRLRQICGK